MTMHVLHMLHTSYVLRVQGRSLSGLIGGLKLFQKKNYLVHFLVVPVKLNNKLNIIHALEGKKKYDSFVVGIILTLTFILRFDCLFHNLKGPTMYIFILISVVLPKLVTRRQHLRGVRTPSCPKEAPSLISPFLCNVLKTEPASELVGLQVLDLTSQTDQLNQLVSFENITVHM